MSAVPGTPGRNRRVARLFNEARAPPSPPVRHDYQSADERA